MVLLQEVSTEFFDETLYPSVKALKDLYHIHLQDPKNEKKAGTAILLKKLEKGGRVQQSEDSIFIKGSSKTGGWSKGATIVPVTLVGRKEQIILISLHVVPIRKKK